jgi:hypothetical protein
MFTQENTEAFTAEEIEILNAALAVRLARDEDENSASDAINNAWHRGATLVELI